MKIYKLTTLSYLLIAGMLTMLASCKKAVEISSPPNVLTTDKVFNSDASAIAATLSDYTSLGTFDANFIPFAGLYIDEFNQPTLNATSTEFATGTLSTTNGAVANIWQNLYVSIYNANSNIEQLKITSGVSDSVKKQCTGEALFIRAYCHFNLVNIFGDVPLITTTAVTKTANAPRTPVAQVYNQIISDLVQAVSLLTVQYPTAEKIRPNKYAAEALLARVYLYQKNWQQAEAEADAVIGSGLYPLSPLETLFYKNSNEAIWQLWNANGFTSVSTLVPSTTGTPAYTIGSQLLGAFENGDLRKAIWLTSVTVSGMTYIAPYKYKLRSLTTGPNAEYTMYLRSAEQYLIRAEARAQQNTNLAGAISDLNMIRTRAGLPNLDPNLSQVQILSAVTQEERIELFGENGSRFFNLKRTDQINAIMGPLKTTWSTVRSPLFPIPKTQISINASLAQNPGYH